MKDLQAIPKSLQSRPFSTQEALKAGLSLYRLRQWVNEGRLEQSARGIYQATDLEWSEEDAFRAATLAVGFPSAIGLLSALAYYQLTDQIPRQTWILVPDSKRTSIPSLKVFRIRQPDWQIGIRRENGYWITTIERTLVECLHYRSKLGYPLGLEALKTAVRQKKTTLGKVLDLSASMKLDHRIKNYIEALS